MTDKLVRRIPKKLTATLYVYLRKENAEYAREEANKRGISYSQFVDSLVQAKRTSKPVSLPVKSKAA